MARVRVPGARARWVVLGGVIGITACLPTLLRPAQADRPEKIDRAIEAASDFHTYYLEYAEDQLLQIDVDARIFSITTKNTHLHWDGTSLWMVHPSDTAPTLLPQVMADRVGQAWDEWRSGFPGTTFTVRDPRQVAPDAYFYAPGDTDAHVQIDLPFAWDDPWATFLVIKGDGSTPGRLSIFEKATGKPLVVGSRPRPRDGEPELEPGHDAFLGGDYSLEVTDLAGRLIDGADTDVPLAPWVYSSEWPAVSPFGWKWHEYRSRVQLVRQPTDPPGERAGLSAAVHGSCASVGQTIQAAIDDRWSVPVEDPERVEVADLAAAECPSIVLNAEVTGFQGPGTGQRACFEATYTLVDTSADPEVVVATQTVNQQCTTAPLSDQRAWPVSIAVPLGTDLTALEVRATATVALYCLQAGSDIGRASVGFGRSKDVPTLLWPGCTPGFHPE